MDKKTIIAGVLVLAFLSSGGGFALASLGIVVSLAGSLSSAAGGAAHEGSSESSSGGVPAGTVCDPGGEAVKDNVPGMGTYTVSPEQMGNAAVIVHTGDKRKIPQKGEIVAIMTALQESNLKNLNYGDRDSLGLFQQRPGAGWGSPKQITDPPYASNAFYGGPQPPSPRGLVDINGWEKMPPGTAAQTVQVSAFPDAYDKWESLAGKIVGRAKHIKCDDVGASGQAGKVIAAAKKYLGTPYCWAAGDAKGPTHTPDCPSGADKGFDCSGLTLYAYAQVGITLGHYTGDQYQAGPHVSGYSGLKPGDLMFFSDDGTEGGIHHVSMYLGNNEMIHAPHTGADVEIVKNVNQNSYWMHQYFGGTRLLKEDADKDGDGGKGGQGGGKKGGSQKAMGSLPGTAPVAQLPAPARAARTGGLRRSPVPDGEEAQ